MEYETTVIIDGEKVAVWVNLSWHTVTYLDGHTEYVWRIDSATDVDGQPIDVTYEMLLSQDEAIATAIKDWEA